jgi:hypothetical protein
VTLYDWCEFAFLSVVLGMHYGLDARLGRALLTVAWFVMFLLLLLAAFGRRL